MRRYSFPLLLWVTSVPAQTLTVTPARILVDQTVDIRAAGLPPGERLTLRSILTDGAEQTWESQAEFTADADGTIDVAAQAPVKGSWKGISAMGPVWSMTPTSKGVTKYSPPQQFEPQEIRFDLLRENAVIATARLTQMAIGEGVRQIRVTGHLHGMLFLPSGDGPFPGVLVLGGSEGGFPSRRAAWLASHGYAALALAYFHFEDLPADLEDIPLEYFGQALAWMMKRPEIVADRIAVLGTSRGGELALQLGSMYPQIKAVVAYVGANVRFRGCCGNRAAPAWTWQGEPLAFVRMEEHGPEELLARIRIENMKGPILFIAGDDDRIWNSAGMAREAVEHLRHEHFAFPVENLTYAHAGHIAGRPEIVPEWHGQLRHPISGRPNDYGGSPEGNALSSIDASPRVLDFLKLSLSGRTD